VIGLDFALGADPALLAEHAGMPPDPWQCQVLRSTSPRVLLNCSRQAGKSSVTAVLAVHVAVYQPGSLVLMLSPAQRQSAELFRKAIDVYRALGRPVPASSETVLRLELENGSRIVALPGKESTIRGFSGVKLLAIDEAARVPDELYLAVRPMLAVSGGRIIALSTPFGKRGWWHREWTEGGPTWERVEVPASMCLRISPAFLEEERRSLGSWFFDQEYDCRFRDAVDNIFSSEDIEAAVSSDVAPLRLEV